MPCVGRLFFGEGEVEFILSLYEAVNYVILHCSEAEGILVNLLIQRDGINC
jgi:hypothetical protein